MISLTRWKIKNLTKKIKTLHQNRLHNQPSDEALKKEIASYIALAELYKKNRGNAKFPHADLMMVECYRYAASLNDAWSNYQIGRFILEEAKYRESLQKTDFFASIANEKYMKQQYAEAQAYLLNAEKFGSTEAKRMRGLCYLNGWGVDTDKEKGFALIVESIDKEGSWDKVPQIFAELGLNKPEFFSEITHYRK